VKRTADEKSQVTTFFIRFSDSTPLQSTANPSDKSLGYFQSSAIADWITFCAAASVLPWIDQLLVVSDQSPVRPMQRATTAMLMAAARWSYHLEQVHDPGGSIQCPCLISLEM